MDLRNAQVKARRARGGSEKSIPQGASLQSRERGIEEASGFSGDISKRNAGTFREGQVDGYTIVGGIINQLIKQTQDQLGEAIACIEWYERKKGELSSQLETLHQLLEQAEAEEVSSPDQSDQSEQ